MQNANPWEASKRAEAHSDWGHEEHVGISKITLTLGFGLDPSTDQLVIHEASVVQIAGMGTEVLRQFEDLIDEVTGTARWIENQRKGND